MVRQFPPIELQTEKNGGDNNPAIRLFGRRFFADQTVSELLLELLLVATSQKVIGDVFFSPTEVLPTIDLLRSWPRHEPLKYAPKAHLNLKLFVFLGASKLDTRHATHKEHYRELISMLTRKVSVFGGMDSKEVMKTLENLFLGFQSVGGNRTWCAQAFLPISASVIGAETLWNDTEARREGVDNWAEVIEDFSKYFSFGRHRFLARGGELLYLQLCNALRQAPATLEKWFIDVGVGSSHNERNPDSLHLSLKRSVDGLFNACPETVSKLADFVDSTVESATAMRTDYDAPPNRRLTACGWCPEESWQEGILFAIEFRRLCDALVDPVERIELLEILCSLQLLRSLCAQSARYARADSRDNTAAGPLSYVWAVSDPAGEHTAVKQISRRNLNAVQRMIYDALRHPDLRAHSELGKDDMYSEADRRYGHNLFLTVAKRIGLVVPKRGAGARFVFNEKLLRCLVLSVIRPGERVTYDAFKRLLFGHYGIAVDDETVGRSCLWSGTTRLSTLGGSADAWLIEMLEASGMLIRLSDSCSLVINSFGIRRDAI